MLYEHAGQNYLWFNGVFCGYRWKNLELPDSKFGIFFKTKQDKICVPISIIWSADSVATYASLDQILWYNM